MPREVACPIAGEKTDEWASRINGGIVCAMVLVSLLGHYPWLVGYLVLDFGLKVFTRFSLSPNCLIARRLARLVRLPQRHVDAAPKRFAALLGLVLSTGALLAAYASGSDAAFRLILAVLAVCSALESFAGMCLGCIVYGALPAPVARVFLRRVSSSSAY